MKSSGLFISVEGAEGVGKSTFCHNLANFYKNSGKDIRQTLEPGGTEVGKSLRSLFLNPPPKEPLNIKTELFLILAARVQNIQQHIKPWLDSGHIVICDRFLDSTFLYQGIFGGMDLSVIENLNSFATGALNPDITFLIDCDVSVSLDRIRQREQNKANSSEGDNRFDKALEEDHRKFRDGFLKIARSNPQRIFVLDGSLSEEKLLNSAVAKISEFVKK